MIPHFLFLAIVPMIGGVILGGVYFYMMWLNVNAISHAKHPRLALAAGSISRLLMACGAFFFILQWAKWYSLIAALIGFIMARYGAVSFAKKESKYL
ncbi:MAG: hypothetical protein GF401_16470 [Chitinivibrionales bacterium]|nr:hypothetical protein [Chitinivibrionales bacterium]